MLWTLRYRSAMHYYYTFVCQSTQFTANRKVLQSLITAVFVLRHFPDIKPNRKEFYQYSVCVCQFKLSRKKDQCNDFNTHTVQSEQESNTAIDQCTTCLRLFPDTKPNRKELVCHYTASVCQSTQFKLSRKKDTCQVCLSRRLHRVRATGSKIVAIFVSVDSDRE